VKNPKLEKPVVQISIQHLKIKIKNNYNILDKNTIENIKLLCPWEYHGPMGFTGEGM
jgi:hypothetical protein